jgi:hypothetical protein
VVLLKPSQYDHRGYVARFHYGFMPNATLAHMGGMTPDEIDGRSIELHMIDEYVERDLGYLSLLHRDPGYETIVAFVGVMSSQFHRALDLSAYALNHGVRHAIVGGSHAMTCDTSEQQNRGVSFAVAEAELIWQEILSDAIAGELKPVYGSSQRWIQDLPPTVIKPLDRSRLSRYAVRMQGIYPARGCPYRCSFCSITKIAGRKIRYQPLEATIESLRVAKAAGARLIMFTSDNFNKIPLRKELLAAMIDEKIDLPFVVQCDVQIAREGDLVELLARAGCVQMFVGVESFKRETLVAVDKRQNHPVRYAEIVRLCDAHGIASHFSNIIGFEQDDEKDIYSHLDQLITLGPDIASFYIMVPIPGTDQYDDFRRRGLLTEANIDRISAHSLTWRHPNLAPDRARELLFHSYRAFYAVRRLPASLAKGFKKTKGYSKDVKMVQPANWLTSRLSVAMGVHPMAGGLVSRRFDHQRDYTRLRRERFGVDLVPLPRSMATPSG